jgi:hypothetical protein
MSEIKKTSGLALPKENYKIILIGLALVIIGFALMSGGGSENPAEFDPEIFSFRRITLAPFVVMLGYGVVLYAIMKRPKVATKDTNETSSN